jgi:hypothetical protein
MKGDQGAIHRDDRTREPLVVPEYTTPPAHTHLRRTPATATTTAAARLAA